MPLSTDFDFFICTILYSHNIIIINLLLVCLWFKTVQVYPPDNMVVSRGQARSLLARLRGLQEASGMLKIFASQSTFGEKHRN